MNLWCYRVSENLPQKLVPHVLYTFIHYRNVAFGSIVSARDVIGLCSSPRDVVHALGSKTRCHRYYDDGFIYQNAIVHAVSLMRNSETLHRLHYYCPHAQLHMWAR